MKAHLVFTCMAAVVLLVSGCATKKYVRNSTAPIQAKVDQVGQEAAQNSEQINQTRTDFKTDLKDVDERATNGISAAKETAKAAADRAENATDRANQAAQTADQAAQSSDKNNRDLSSLRNVVSNIDDYRLQSSITVPFDFDKAALSREAKAQLDQLAEELKADKRYFIALEGFTDRIGAGAYNDALSQRRADVVMRYLVAEHDVPLYRVHVIGLGKDKPVDEGRSREARAKNRRVEVKVFSADQITASLTGGSE